MRTLGLTTILFTVATTVAGAQTPTPVTPPTQTPPALQQRTEPQLPSRAAPQVEQRTDMPAAQVLATIPANAATINHWYKQNVYDSANNKIGDIEDVLVDRDAKVVALVIGVGGFLGLGEKRVAVPYNAVHMTTKDANKWYLVMNSTKDALMKAPGYKYDRTSMTWMPESVTGTVGSGSSKPITPSAPIVK